jgi:hypothetical protein
MHVTPSLLEEQTTKITISSCFFASLGVIINGGKDFFFIKTPIKYLKNHTNDVIMTS